MANAVSRKNTKPETGEGADMFSIDNDEYLVLEDTILNYKGKASELVVPSVIDGHEVKCIGAGAINDRTDITSIEVSEGIESIGKRGIGGISSLRKLVLPQSLKSIDSYSFDGDSHLGSIMFRVETTRSRYNSILAASYADIDGHRIIDGIPSDITSLSAFNVGLYKLGFGLIKPVAKISRDARRLYIVPESKAFSFSLVGGESGISEEDDLMDKIRGLQAGTYVNPVDNQAEIICDSAMRKGDDLKTGPVLVPVFYESDVDIQSDTVRLMIELRICKAYWITVNKLVCEGASYFTKNYCYCTSDSNCPYISIPSENFYDEQGQQIRDMFLITKLKRKNRFLNMI